MQTWDRAEKISESRRAVPHPLLSTRIGTLLECFREYGWPDKRFRRRASDLLAVAALRTPLHHLERWRVRKRVEEQKLTGPPIFIIGHWRSGTTHLHQLLSQDPQFGFVTLMQAAFPLDFLTSVGAPLVALLLPPTRMVDQIPISIDSPWEEEMAMACFGPLSFFHAFFFPHEARRIYRSAIHFDDVAPERVAKWWSDYLYFLKKVQSAQRGRRLVIKNPANSARVAALRERLPGAKFIHIHRHPEEVYASTMLLHRQARKAWALQDGDGANLRDIVLANYADLMSECFTQTRDLPGNELIEIRMSDLETQPVATLESIYRQLELPAFDTARPHFAIYLDRLGVFPKNRLSLEACEREAVREKLRPVFERWDYE